MNRAVDGSTPAPSPRPTLWAGLAVVGAAMLFGTTGTARELGAPDAGSLSVGTLRIIVGSVALWIFARSWPQWSVLRRWPVVAVAGGLGVAIYQPAFFTGTGRSGVALGTVVAIGSGPVFAGLIEWVRFGQRPSHRWAIATAVTIVGGSLLVFSSSAGGGGSDSFDVLGIAAALAAGLGYAIYAIAAKVLIDRGVDSTVALAWPFTIGAVLLAPIALSEPLGWVLTAPGAVMLVHLGVVTVGVAYVLYGWGLRMIATSSAVTLTLAEPLTAAVAAAVLLGERLEVLGWIGAAVVLAGLFLTGWSATPRPRTGRVATDRHDA